MSALVLAIAVVGVPAVALAEDCMQRVEVSPGKFSYVNTWEVRLENNGSPLQVPGVPGSLASAWQATSVPVAEVQSIVSG